MIVALKITDVLNQLFLSVTNSATYTLFWCVCVCVCVCVCTGLYYYNLYKFIWLYSHITTNKFHMTSYNFMYFLLDGEFLRKVP
jgi:hypothetical protein